jgi:cellobiose phosphorylase
MLVRHTMMAAFLMMVGLMATGGVYAQDSADQILEKARAEAADTEKLKKILNEEPDQNVRLAAFELMIKNDNGTMHEIAVEAGLASADKLLQAAAFKEAIMSLDRLHLVLVVDPDVSDAIQKMSQEYIDKNGDQYVIPLDKKDREAGTFSARSLSGEVTGTHLTYLYGKSNGTLSLTDDNAVSGDIMHQEGYNKLKFIATGKIR